MSARSGGRWGSSGVAAMRAEHEAEMTALKEEKQDLLLKYHATSAKLNEEQQRCAELNGEVEEARAQFVSLQVRGSSVFTGGGRGRHWWGPLVSCRFRLSLCFIPFGKVLSLFPSRSISGAMR